jgi:hypothetical protein
MDIYFGGRTSGSRIGNFTIICKEIGHLAQRNHQCRMFYLIQPYPFGQPTTLPSNESFFQQ